MNKWHQLIEYVINDEKQKAEELFHDIVVGQSRQIYENIMAEEEELDEAKHEEDLDEAEEMDEGAMGGDAQDDLIDEVETDEEQDMSMEGEEEMEIGGEEETDDFGGDEETDDFGGDEGGSEAATKDDIMNLEDKLDELMAEFEAKLGGDMGDDMGDGDDFGADEGGDAIEVDDTEEMMPMAEAVSLKAAPKPVTGEEGSINKKSIVAANSGAAGMAAKPVHATGTEAKGRPAPTTKDLISDFQNKAGTGMKNLSAATKPHLSQASGVNTKSPLPGGRKG